MRMTIIPSRVSGWGYKIGPVCVSVCQLFSTLISKPFETSNECSKVFQARILAKRARRGRGRQRSGVFIWHEKSMYVFWLFCKKKTRELLSTPCCCRHCHDNHDFLSRLNLGLNPNANSTKKTLNLDSNPNLILDLHITGLVWQPTTLVTSNDLKHPGHIFAVRNPVQKFWGPDRATGFYTEITFIWKIYFINP